MRSLIRLFTAIKSQRRDSWSSSEDGTDNQDTGKFWMTQNNNPLHNIEKNKIAPLHLSGSSSEGANNHFPPGEGDVFNDRERGRGVKH